MAEQINGFRKEIRRVLICGLGSIGKRHFRILQEYWENIEIAILRSGHGPGDLSIELDNQIFYSLEEALAWKPDAAIIATPASEHFSTALPLARDGIPLLIEKPIGDGRESQKDWEELIHLSNSVPIEVAYVLRHDPCTITIANSIKEGAIGKLADADFYCGSWLPDWRPSIDYRQSVSSQSALGGGVLLELSHEIDLAQYLLGNYKLCSALLHQSGLLEIDVEDQADLLVYSSDNCLISIRLNFCTRPSSRHVCIRGSNGAIYWDLIAGRVDIVSSDISQKTFFQSPISTDERYVLQIKHFLSCATGKIEPRCSVLDGLKVLEIITQARKINACNHV